jgi:hypothetical protein
MKQRVGKDETWGTVRWVESEHYTACTRKRPRFENLKRSSLQKNFRRA